MPIVNRLFSSEVPEERNSKVKLGQVDIKNEDEEGDNSDIVSSPSLTSKSDSNDNDLLLAVDAEEVQQINRDVSFEYDASDDKEFFKNIDTN